MTHYIVEWSNGVHEIVPESSGRETRLMIETEIGHELNLSVIQSGSAKNHGTPSCNK